MEKHKFLLHIKMANDLKICPDVELWSFAQVDVTTVPETFYFTIFAFAHRAFSMRSPFYHSAFIVHSFTLSAQLFCAHCLQSLRRSFKVHSVCAQQSFNISFLYKFNSFPLTFGTPKWKERQNKIEHVFLKKTGNSSKTV